jgi:DNA-binding XRE family transcriptional regulator
VYVVMDSARVRTLRKEKGMSQRELAEVSGVCKRTVRNVESGKVHSRRSTARKIGAVFGVDPRSLATVAHRA